MSHRHCKYCNTIKSVEDFHNAKYNRRCKTCTNIKNRRNYHKNKAKVRIIQRRYEQAIQERARNGDKVLHSKGLMAACRLRAKRFGVPCTITYRDIPVPEVCPVLGIPLKLNVRKMRFDSATVDRIIPNLGYVPGNVIVVSLKANLIKTSATAAEILRVGMFYAQLAAKDIAG